MEMTLSRTAALASIRELSRKRDELLDELERSIALAELWPEVFDCGRVAAMFFDGHADHPATLVVERRDGERREWPLSVVPAILHPKVSRQ